MKNILVISPIYPGNGTPVGYTPVVHYFVKEWVNLGFNVRVIHTSAYYPRVYYMAPQWLRTIVENRVGIALPSGKIDNEGEYELDGVKVFRVPVKKSKPHGAFSDFQLLNLYKKTKEYLQKNKFIPNVIISHWVNPTADLMYRLKMDYGCTSTMVLHGNDSQFDLYKNEKTLFESIDIWGYRAEKTKVDFENKHGIPKYSFRCYSGIPSSYVRDVVNRKWTSIKNFVYVGQLIERKFPDSVITAVNNVFCDSQYNITIVGEGAMRSSLESQIKKLGTSNGSIVMTGRVPREQVVDYLDSADVFVMISRNEVFGLVYLEAMSRGCITIASKNEGMEGIIIDGKNGFLCEAGNTLELQSTIRRIKSLSPEQLLEISENGKKTANILTDKNVAKDYIDTVFDFSEKKRSETNESCFYHSLI